MDYFKKHTISLITKLLLGCCLLISSCHIAKAQEIGIYGWPNTTFPQGSPYLGFGNDPIIGRLTCPPLTRFNHNTQNSEALIIVPVFHTELLWEYKIRQGIYWWDGSPFTTEHLISFFRKNLSNILSEKGLQNERIPNYELIPSQNSLKIKWQQAPNFGPFFLNDVSLTREVEPQAGQLTYECVGNFFPQEIKENWLILEPVKAYSYSWSKIKFSSFNNKSSNNNKKNLIFKLPGDTPTSEISSSPIKPDKCTKADLPYASVLIWNLKHPLASQQKLRKLFSQLIPYEQIISQAAGGYGKYIDSVISQDLYQQNTKKKLPPAYNVKEVQEQLLKDGFLLPKLKRNALGRSQSKFSIQNSPLTSDLIEKVLADSFGAAGFHIKFDLLEKDDQLASLKSLHLPDLNTNAISFWRKIYPGLHPKKSGDFDELLTNLALFNRSLSFGKADLDLARKIINKTTEMILITPILQHAACIESMGLSLPKNSADYLNPDWLRNTVKGM